MAVPAAFRADSWVKAATGQAITGAHVYLCTQPVTLPQLESAGVPNQAICFTDSTGLTTVPQPLISDAFGHTDGYFLTGLYTMAIYVNGQLQQTYLDQALVGGGLTSLNGVVGGISLVSSGSLQFTTSGQNITLSMTQGFPTPLLADTVRLNVLNDNAWDAVNAAPLITGLMGTTNGTTGFGMDLFQSVQGVVGQTVGIIYPTATSFAAGNYTHGSSGSTSTLVGVNGPVNGSGNSTLPFLAFYRLTFKVGVTLNPSCRYWIGLACALAGSTVGLNGTAVLGTTRYAADIPNATTLAFRYSPGTDTTWKAVSIFGGVSATSTVVDTGVTPVNSTPQIFEIVPNLAGTSVDFYINYAKVATINTNLPPITGDGNSMASIFACGDNKNTANAPALTFYYGLMSLKGFQAGT